MIKYHGLKLTANQLAKEILADQMFLAIEIWQDKTSVNIDAMTDKEKLDVHNQIVKRYNGVMNYLGIPT
jgi:hypothetical protein